MAKSKLKVSRVTALVDGSGKWSVVADNGASVNGEKIFHRHTKKELTAAEVKKHPANEMIKRRVKLADRIVLQFETVDKYKIGDEIAVTF